MMVALVAATGGALAARYTGQGIGRAAVSTVAIELSVAIALAWGTWGMRREIAFALRWSAVADECDEATGVRGAALMLAFPRRYVTTVVWRVLLLAPVTAAVMFSRQHGRYQLPLAGYVMVGSLFVVVYGVAVGYFGAEFALRPVRVAGARWLARAQFEHLEFVSIQRKLLGGLTALSLVLSFIVASLVVPGGAEVAAISRVTAITLLLVPTLGLSVMIPLTRPIVGPIRDLIKGTERVAHGDLDVTMPITATDELGELVVNFNEMVEGLRERELLRARNAALVDELRASRQRIVTAADAERRRVERDLHDGAQQHLMLLRLKLRSARLLVTSDDGAAVRAALEDLDAELDRALGQLRNLAHGLYPVELEHQGLSAALQQAAAQATVPVRVDVSATARYPTEIEAAVYFCCLEALQNVAKHAGDGVRAAVSIRADGEELLFEISDDGRGFDPGPPLPTSGIQNMIDRIGALGGELTIRSVPGTGTTITGRLPIPQPIADRHTEVSLA
jgi:signal transduction histidine kinase